MYSPEQKYQDQKYIDALVNSNSSVLNEMYQKFYGKIKWMVLQGGGSETEAADIFQEGLIAIYDRAKTGNFTLACPFEAFLYLVCRNKWMNELDKKKTRRVTSDDPSGFAIGEDSFKLAEEYNMMQERKDLIAQKVAELGESCRQLLTLSWSGQPMEQVARTLNMSSGFARKKKSECMKKLINLVKQSPQFKSLKW